MKEKILLLLTIMFASNIHALNYEKLITTNMMNDSSFQNEKYDSFCSGLVIIGANYNGNKYALPNIDEGIHVAKNYGAGTCSDNDYTMGMVDEIWVLSTPESSTDTSEILKRDKQRKILSQAVPGDILVVNEGILGRHVVILQNLNYPLNSNLITDYAQVDVIHSIPFLRGEQTQNHQNMVRKNVWTDIQNNVTVYKLRRLLENE